VVEHYGSRDSLISGYSTVARPQGQPNTKHNLYRASAGDRSCVHLAHAGSTSCALSLRFFLAANLQLTDAEAVKFWPIYDQYTAELVKINDAKYAALKEYATNYATLTDDQALSLARQIIGVDQSVAQLRLKYVPIFSKVISGKKTALFFQLDRRLVMLIDLQLASQIPMIEP